jgi:hypothetical protein
MGLSDIIKKVVDMLPGIMMAVGLVFIVGMFVLIIGGSFNKQAADGNIPVSTQTITALDNAQSNLTTTVSTVGDQATTAVNYLPLIIVLAIALGFLGFLGFKAFRNSEGGGI